MPDHTIIIYKKKNQVVNTVSLLRLLGKLKGNSMYQVTFEALNEPDVIIAERNEELKLTMVSGPHTCATCGWQCTCSNQPCSCCKVENDIKQELSKNSFHRV